MELSSQEYRRLASQVSPRSPVIVDCLKAFFVGGAICTIGQLLTFGAESLGLGETSARFACTTCLIFLSALFTGLGLYDKLAKHAGAGTLVPITGFANAITAPAIEFKTEGLVLGLSAKMFTIAGPVIVYGISAGIVYGILYYLIGML